MNNVNKINKNTNNKEFVQEVYDSSRNKLGCHYSWNVIQNEIERHGIWTICMCVSKQSCKI